MKLLPRLTILLTSFLEHIIVTGPNPRSVSNVVYSYQAISSRWNARNKIQTSAAGGGTRTYIRI